MIMMIHKEKYLLTRDLMERGRNNGGTLFGGSISNYFLRCHHANAYKRELIMNNEIELFDKNYQNPNYHTSSYDGRNMTIRDIDIYFSSKESVSQYVESIYKIPGVHDVVECPSVSSIYKRHVLFDKNYTLNTYKVRYLYGHSFCSKGTPITISLDVVISKPESRYRHPPTVCMQELTVKQLLWDSEGIKTSNKYEHHLVNSFNILDDFIHNICFIKEESWDMRENMRNLLSEEYDTFRYVNSKASNALEKILESRTSLISRLMMHHKKYNIVNSPFVYEKRGSCGICLSEKDNVFKWKTDKNNGQLYCEQCICGYMKSIRKIDNEYHNHKELENAPKHFHDDPILTPYEWKFLNIKQIYLIENIFVCPVGNKADFSCTD